MASQILHDLIDELENAVAPIKGLVASAEPRIKAAIAALRQHAEADGRQLLTDTETAARTLGGQVAADAAPLIGDVQSGVTDLARTAEQAGADPTAPADTQPAA